MSVPGMKSDTSRKSSFYRKFLSVKLSGKLLYYTTMSIHDHRKGVNCVEYKTTQPSKTRLYYHSLSIFYV